jgi:hypothetical protein
MRLGGRRRRLEEVTRADLLGNLYIVKTAGLCFWFVSGP